MPDYLPVALDGICNAGTSLLKGDHDVELGPRLMRGIPFELGADPNRCLVLVDDPAGRGVSFPEGVAVHSVTVAHRLVASGIRAGATAGDVVGEYVFHYHDGAEVRVPIRERLEVAMVPTSGEEWGQVPLLALPDQFDGLPPRYAGDFATTGNRLTNVSQPPVQFYLWAWRQPRPEAPLAGMEFVGAGGTPRLVVAGITLGLVAEDPLRLRPAQPVRLDLPAQAIPSARNGISIEVDRGMATFAHELPADPLATYLADPQKGWGEPRNRLGTAAYTSVAALPSATMVVRRDGEVLGRAGWRELIERGSVDDDQVKIRLVETGRNWVKTVVLDDATDEPIPCRVHFRSPDGVPYPPYGHPEHVNDDLVDDRAEFEGIESGAWHLDVGGDVRLGRTTYAYIDGTCEGWLPRGDVVVDVARGFEYEPLRTVVRIEPGQRELRLRLKRWSDVARDGWFSGDTHVHFLSVDGAHLEGSGEDLNVVNLLATQWGALFTNTEDFTGRPSVSRDGRTVVYVSQENRQHVLGHLTLLGLKAPVMPWCSDGTSEAEMGGSLETTLAHWADRCHEQGGLVVLPHFPNPYGEPASLVAGHRVDAVEFLDHKDLYHHAWYRYLNCGYRLPLVGGTDKMSTDVPVGLSRTYARIPADEAFSYDAWCRAVAAGRTFMSLGPLISLSVDGGEIGDTVRLPRGGGMVEVEARADSIFPIHELQIVEAGRVVASSASSAGARSLSLRDRIAVASDTWIAARVAGPRYIVGLRHRDSWARGVMAHTSPIYVSCGPTWDRWDQTAADEMLSLIDGGLRYLREVSPQWPDDRVTHHHGEADHLAYLERPFVEARRALARRMADAGG